MSQLPQIVTVGTCSLIQKHLCEEEGSHLVQGWFQILNPGTMLIKALRLYLRFAVLHSLWKVFRFLFRKRRFEQVSRRLPGRKIDWTGTALMENGLRYQEFCNEMVQPTLAIKDDSAPSLATWDIPEFGVVTRKASAVEAILRTKFDSFTKPGPDDDVFGLMREFLGIGIFTLRHGKKFKEEDALWKFHRRTALLLFTKKNFNDFMRKVFKEKCDDLLADLDAVADGENKIDLQASFFEFTFASIDRIFFNSSSPKDGEFGTRAYAQAFDGAHRAMVAYLLRATPFFILSHVILPFPFGKLEEGFTTSWLSSFYQVFSNDHRMFREHLRTLRKITKNRIVELRNAPDVGERKDLISHFMARKEWSDDELYALTMNFAIAGRDTTASLLTWLFFELCVHPEIQEHLAEEIQRVLGRESIPTYDDLMDPSKLPFLNGVLYEALRLHPPVPQDQKESVEKVEIDGIKLDPNTRVTFAPYIQGRDPNVYENPENFEPSRWIPFTEPSPWTFTVFQGDHTSPRSCIGRDMAKFEAKFVIVRLLQRFCFSLDPAEDPSMVTNALMLTAALMNRPDHQDPLNSSYELNVRVHKR